MCLAGYPARKPRRLWQENRSGVFACVHLLSKYAGSEEKFRVTAEALHEFPAAREPACDSEQYDRYSGQNQHLGPQLGQRLVAPEHFREAVDGPGVNGQKARLL